MKGENKLKWDFPFKRKWLARSRSLTRTRAMAMLLTLLLTLTVAVTAAVWLLLLLLLPTLSSVAIGALSDCLRADTHVVVYGKLLAGQHGRPWEAVGGHDALAAGLDHLTEASTGIDGPLQADGRK